MSDFNIIIGADTKLAESQIKDMIREIGTDFPLGLTITISNYSQLIGEIEDIQKLLNNMGRIDANFDWSSQIDENKLKNMTENVGENMKKASRHANEYTDALRDALLTYDNLLKISQKVVNTENGRKSTFTQKEGNEFISTTKVKQDNIVSTPVMEETVIDISKIDKYIEKIVDSTNEWKHVTEYLTTDVESLRNKVVSLDQLAKEDPSLFEDELLSVRKLYKELERLESSYKEKFKELSRIKKMLSKEDFSMINEEDRLKPLSQYNSIEEMAKSSDIGEDVFGERIEAWVEDFNRLVNLNKENKQTQKEVEKLVSKIEKDIEKWKENGNLAKSEIEQFESSLKNLHVLNDNFNESLERSRELFVQLSNEDKRIGSQKEDREKAVLKIEKERLEWQKKINQLEREGYTHRSQMKALNTRLNKLNENDLDTLEDVNKHLREMNEQYARAVEYQKKTQFGIRKTNKVEDLRGRVGDNLDEELVGLDQIERINKEINKIFDTSSVEQFEKSVRRVVKLYDDLLSKQKEAVEQKKLEVLQEQEREKIHKHLQEMERKTIEEQTRIANEENERKADEWEDRMKMAEEMSSGRSKVEMDKARESIKNAKKEAEAFNKEQDRLYENQQRINKETDEFLDTMKELRQSEFIDESDLSKAKELIGDLSNESKTLASDLNSVRSELSNVTKELKKREEAQRKVNALNNENQLKAQDMLSRNIVPDHLINNFKQLSDSLSFDSTKNEIDQVKNELNKLVQLEQELKQHNKETEAYKKLILKAEQDSIKVTDKYMDRVEEISYMSKKQLNDSSRLAEVEERISIIIDEINKKKERGTYLTYEEQRGLDAQVTKARRLLQYHKEIEQQMERQNKLQIQISDKFESVSYRATRGFDRYPSENRQIQGMVNDIEKRIEGLKDLNGDEFTKEYRKIEEMMTDVNRKSRDLRDTIREHQNSMFGRLQHAMKQVPVWISAMTLFYGTMSQVQQGFQSLLDVDASMTNLRKVANETNKELEQFRYLASEIGYELGVLTSDVINATTEFARLGYSLEEASILGRSSILYANVGDMSVQSATQNIVSAIKGFGIEVDSAGANVQNLVDIFNEVANNFAISAEGIGESLRRSSAVLSQAGNSIEKSVALVTAANTTIQDPRKVGNAMKTISMRLRGIDEEGNEIAELVPELERVFKSFMDATILEDENTFKSTYDIFDELSDHWETLTDKQRAYITELIGGKEQGAIVSSIISNWEDATQSYEVALNSAGSAQREFNAYMDSFQYKIGQLKVSIEEFWVTFLNDEAIKTFIDFLTESVQLATRLTELIGGGAIGSSIVGLIAVLGSKSFKDLFFKPDELKKIREQTFSIEDSFGKINKNVAKAGSSLLRLGNIVWFVAKNVFKVVGISVAIFTAIDAIIKFARREEIARKKRLDELDDEIKAYENLKNTIKEVNLERYLELERKMGNSNLNVEEYEEYESIQRDVIKNMPELIDHYDEHGRAVLRDAESIRQLLKDKERLNNQNKMEQFDLSVDEANFKNLNKSISRIQEYMDLSRSWTEQGNAMEFAKKYIDENIKGIDLTEEELISRLEEMYKEFEKMMPTDTIYKATNLSTFGFSVVDQLRRGNIDGAIQFLEERAKAYRENTNKFGKEIEEAKAEMQAHMSEFRSLLNEGFDRHMLDKGIDVESNEFLFIQKIKNKIIDDLSSIVDEDVKDEILRNIPQILNEITEMIDKSEVDISQLVNPTSLQEDKIRENFATFMKSVDESSKLGRTFIDVLKEMQEEEIKASRNMSNNPIKMFDFSKDVLPFINKYIDAVSKLDSAYRTLRDGNKLNVKQIFDLVQQYPELTKHIEVQNGEISLSKEAIEELAEVREKEFKRDLVRKREEMLKSRENAEEIIKDILAKAKGEQQLGKIREKMVRQSVTEMSQSVSDINSEIAKIDALQGFGVSWGKMYEARKNALEQERDALKENIKQVENNLELYTSMQEEIDRINDLLDFDWSKILGDLGSSNSQMRDAIYVADNYNRAIRQLNYQIEMQQKIQEKNSKWSDSYKKSLEEEIKLTQSKKKAVDDQIKSLENQINKQEIQRTGLITLGKEENKTARARQAELQQEIDRAKDELYNLKSESSNIYSRISQLTFSLIETNKELYKSQRDALSDDIAYADHAMNLYDKYSDNYKKHAEMKIEYLKQIEKYHKQELDYLELERKTNDDLTESQKDQLDTLIRQSTEALLNAQKDILDSTKSLQSIELDKILEEMSDKASSLAENIEDIRNKMQYDIDEDDFAGQVASLKEIMSLTKAQGLEAKKNINRLNIIKGRYKDNHELTKRITDEIEKWTAELKSTEVEVKGIRKELEDSYEQMADEFVDIYQEQMNLMKRAEDERYNNLMELEEKVHNKRMKQLDDELSQIRKMYEEQLEMIDREEASRDFDNNLEKMQDEAKELRKQIDLLSLDDSYEAKAKRSELVKELTEKELEIAEFQHDRQVDLRKQDIQDDLKAEEEKLQAKRDKYQEDYDRFVENEEKKRKAREDYWEQMLNDEARFASLREEIINGNFDNMLSTVQLWSYNVTSEMGVLGNVITNNFTRRVEEAINTLGKLKEMDIGSFRHSVNVASILSPAQFREGGYTGDWSGDKGKLAVLHKREVVLNQEQTKHILNSAKIIDKLKHIIPSLNISKSISKAVPATSSVINEYKIDVNVENMNGDRSDADIVADQIMRTIKRTRGGRF